MKDTTRLLTYLVIGVTALASALLIHDVARTLLTQRADHDTPPPRNAHATASFQTPRANPDTKAPPPPASILQSAPLREHVPPPAPRPPKFEMTDAEIRSLQAAADMSMSEKRLQSQDGEAAVTAEREKRMRKEGRIAW